MDPQNKRASTKSEGFWIVLCMFFLLENNLLGKTLGWFSLIFLGHGLRDATTCIIRVINSAASSSINAKDFELLMSTFLMMDRHFHTCCLNPHFSSSHPFSHGYGSKPSPSVQFMGCSSRNVPNMVFECVSKHIIAFYNILYIYMWYFIQIQYIHYNIHVYTYVTYVSYISYWSLRPPKLASQPSHPSQVTLSGLPLTLSTKTLRPSISSWPLGHFSRTWATSTVLFPDALKKSPRKRWVGWMMLDGWMVMVDHLPLGWGFQSHDFQWVLNNSSLHSIHDICKVTASVFGPIWLGCRFPVEPQSRIVKLVVRKELEHLSWCFAVLETGKLLRRQMSMPHLSVAFLFGICMVSFGWHRILTVSCRIYTSPAKKWLGYCVFRKLVW